MALDIAEVTKRANEMGVGAKAADMQAEVAWITATAEALAGASADGMDDYLDQPVTVQVAMMGAALEEMTGLPLGQIGQLAGDLSALGGMTDPLAIMGAVNQIVVTAMEIVQGVTAVLSGVAGGVAIVGAAANVIPIVGQIVCIVAEIVAAVLAIVAWALDDDDKEQDQRNCVQDHLSHLQSRCAKLVPKIKATSAAGPVPADLFAPLADWCADVGPSGGGGAHQPSSEGFGEGRLPLCAASVWVALCGDEAGPLVQWRLDAGSKNKHFKMMTTLERNYIESGGTSKRPDGWPQKGPNHGIPRAVRRQMWACCKAIMAARRPGGLAAVTNDGGRMAMAVLQSLLRVQLRMQEEPAPLFGVSENYVRQVAKKITEQYHSMRECPLTFDHRYCSVDLATPILDGIDTFDNGLSELLNFDGTWKRNPVSSLVTIMPSKTFKLREAAVSRVVKTVARLDGRVAKPPRVRTLNEALAKRRLRTPGGKDIILQSDTSSSGAGGGLLIAVAGALLWLASRKGRG